MKNKAPLLSICIPAFKRSDYLRRLLDSIVIQDFDDYEVVITDDSPDSSVKAVAEQYMDRLPIRYFKNPKPLGTPENWNEGIRKADSEWIKLMHDDDWFSTKDALGQFAEAISQSDAAFFVFSAYNNIYEVRNQIEKVRLSHLNERRLRANPLYLFRKNYIGNPSCILFNKKIQATFDKRLKFVVDFGFYLCYLPLVRNQFTYLNSSLVNVGLNASQVTTYTFRVREVEIPENHILLKEIGFNALKNFIVYDYFWRLYRNLEITRVDQIREFGYTDKMPSVLESMIAWQSQLPKEILKVGPFSKCIMLLHYTWHYFKIK